MNKLREKLEYKISVFKEEHLAQELEQITDDFSEKFYDWTQDLDYDYLKIHTTTELLQIFKDKYYE